MSSSPSSSSFSSLYDKTPGSSASSPPSLTSRRVSRLTTIASPISTKSQAFRPKAAAKCARSMPRSPSLTQPQVLTPQSPSNSIALSSRAITQRRRAAAVKASNSSSPTNRTSKSPVTSAEHYQHSFCGMAHVNEGVFFSLRPEARDSAVAISRKTWDLEVPVLEEAAHEGLEKEKKEEEKKMRLETGSRENGHGRGKTAGAGNGAACENESNENNRNKVSVRVTADAWKDERRRGIYYFHVSELYGFIPGTKPRDRCRELEKSSCLCSVSRGCMQVFFDADDGGARAWDRHTVREVSMERLEREGRVVLGFGLRANGAWGVEIVVARLNGAEAGGGQEEVRVVWDRRVVVDVSGWCRGQDVFRRQ